MSRCDSQNITNYEGYDRAFDVCAYAWVCKMDKILKRHTMRVLAVKERLVNFIEFYPRLKNVRSLFI